MNILDTLNETHDMLRLDMSTQEKENFQRRMLRNLKVSSFKEKSESSSMQAIV